MLDNVIVVIFLREGDEHASDLQIRARVQAPQFVDDALPVNITLKRCDPEQGPSQIITESGTCPVLSALTGEAEEAQPIDHRVVLAIVFCVVLFLLLLGLFRTIYRKSERILLALG